MALNLYERRLLNEPEIRLELSGIASGIRQPYDITLELDDSDGYYTSLLTSEELRGKSVVLERYETDDIPTIIFQAYGIITECEIVESICRIKVSISKEDPIFQTMLPKKVYEVGDWSQTPPNIINPSRDLGKPYAIPLGNAKKVPMLYVHANYTSDYYDYVCLGPVQSIPYVYRDKRLVSTSEYTAYADGTSIGYSGYAVIRFTEMQRDPNGNLYEITADVNGMKMGGGSAERNFVNVLKNFLTNTTWGLSQTANSASFTTAASEVSNLYCDGCISEQMSFQTIRDYILKAINGKLDKNESGEWTITIDTYQGTVESSFGSDDGYFNNIIDEGSYKKTPMDSALKKYTLNYRRDGWSGEFTMKNKRDVFSFGEEIEEENPFVRDHTTADRITGRIKNRAIYSDNHLSLTLGMEARQLTDSKVIRVIIPRKNIDANFQIASIQKKLAQFDVELVGYAADIYQYSAGSMPSDPQDDSQPDYEFTPPDAPTSVSISSSGTYQATDGTTMAYVVLQGTAPSVNFQLMLGGYRKSSETVLPYTWVEGSVDSGLVWKVRIDGLVPGQQYDYAMKCRNAFGKDSAFTTVTNQTAPGDSGAPAQVTGISGSGKYKTWQFSWTKNAETDMRNYHVQIATDSGFSSIVYDKYIDGNSVSYTNDSYGYGTMYCRVKAADFTGNESSAWSATASATTSQTGNNDLGDGSVTNAKVANLSADKINAGVLYISNGSVVNSSYGGDKDGNRDGQTHWYTTGGTEIARIGQSTLDGWFIAEVRGDQASRGGLAARTGSTSYPAIRGRTTIGNCAIFGGSGTGEYDASSDNCGVAGTAANGIGVFGHSGALNDQYKPAGYFLSNAWSSGGYALYTYGGIVLGSVKKVDRAVSGAYTLPSNPTGFWAVTINGVACRIPLYGYDSGEQTI